MNRFSFNQLDKAYLSEIKMIQYTDNDITTSTSMNMIFAGSDVDMLYCTILVLHGT